MANFSSTQETLFFPFEGTYKKIFDSYDLAYNGAGATLPDQTIKGDGPVIGGFNFAVFLKEV